MWGLLAIPPIAAMVVSDLRSRTVALWQLAVTCAVLAFVSVAESGFRGALTNMSGNILVCILAGLCVVLYLKARRIQCRDAVGGGDVLFILGLTPLFSVGGFLVFMTVSSLLTLAVWSVYASLAGCRRKRSAEGSVPLISGLGTCLAVHLAALSFDLYRLMDIDSML